MARLWPLPEDRILLMGILNVTPDSFYDGGQHARLDQALHHAEQLIREGADILDIGGESTRPGAQEVPVPEELDRVIPVIEALRRHFDIPISVDTRKAPVAQEALRAGADWINDISALRHDPDMVRVAREYGAPVVLMHMQGTPQTMQQNPTYKDVVQEVYAFLEERIRFAESHGIHRLLVDPGIGFGKTLEHNLALLHNLSRFTELAPVLLGVSRKSMFGHLGAGETPGERLEGTLAAAAVAVDAGVRILRVHDVAAHRKFLTVYQALRPKREATHP